MKQSNSIRGAFQMPTPMSISGRSSSITAAFVSSIIPRIEPSDDEIRTALNILEMSPNEVQCAYCGANATEWDHLRPLVQNQTPTGFISEIRNLVPSCGKCNQSKGNKYWKDWITGDAKLSPKSQHIPDLQKRIERLEEYESWSNIEPLKLYSMVDDGVWEEHWTNWSNLLKAMAKAQSHAIKLREAIEERTRTLLRK
ncbi:MAG: HNH endonuclease [Desulfobacteraceae bacterium]|nr:HNH endonuclease [Desulfobacteraceae bacterium]